MKIFHSILIATLLPLLMACQTSEQAHGIMTGSMLGGIFGSSIGGLMDGPRGHDAGTALGMIVGGAIGAAATAPRTNKKEQTGPVNEYYDETDSYNRRPSSSSGRRPYAVAPRIPAEYEALSIENLRFIDQNHNQALDGNERAKIVFEIRNNGPETIYRVAPVVTIPSKRVVVSPTAVIAAIQPGRAVRYSADIYAKKNQRGALDCAISFAHRNYYYEMCNFRLNTTPRNLPPQYASPYRGR